MSVVPQQGPQQAEPLREFAEYVEQTPEREVEVLRREKYVFRRFPRDMKKQPPVGDGERWEAMAFHLYSSLMELSSRAIRALNAADELAALSASRTTQQDALTEQDWLTADRIEQTLTTIGAITADDAKWLLGQLTKLAKAAARPSPADKPECDCDGGEQGDGLCALPHAPTCPVYGWENRPMPPSLADTKADPQ